MGDNPTDEGNIEALLVALDAELKASGDISSEDLKKKKDEEELAKKKKDEEELKKKKDEEEMKKKKDEEEMKKKKDEEELRKKKKTEEEMAAGGKITGSWKDYKAVVMGPSGFMAIPSNYPGPTTYPYPKAKAIENKEIDELKDMLSKQGDMVRELEAKIAEANKPASATVHQEFSASGSEMPWTEALKRVSQRM
jgi:superfamily II DNA/RNA helicase